MSGALCQKKDFAISVSSDEVPSKKLTLKAPTFVFANKPFTVSGTTESTNQQVYIMLSKETWGIDWFARDETLKMLISDGEGNFETELMFDELGYNKVYAAQKKEWLGIDWLAGDIKSGTYSIIVMDWWIIAMIGVLLVFVMYKKGMLKGIVGKKRRKK